MASTSARQSSRTGHLVQARRRSSGRPCGRRRGRWPARTISGSVMPRSSRPALAGRLHRAEDALGAAGGHEAGDVVVAVEQVGGDARRRRSGCGRGSGTPGCSGRCRGGTSGRRPPPPRGPRDRRRRPSRRSCRPASARRRRGARRACRRSRPWSSRVCGNGTRAAQGTASGAGAQWRSIRSLSSLLGLGEGRVDGVHQQAAGHLGVGL